MAFCIIEALFRILLFKVIYRSMYTISSNLLKTKNINSLIFISAIIK